MKLLKRDDTDHNTTYVTLDDFQKAEASWSVTYLKNETLEHENARLRELLARAIRFVDAFEPRSRAAEVDQQETLRLSRDVLSNEKLTASLPEGES